MKKMRNNAGFSLLEMLVAIAILVILVVAIGTSMEAGTRIYKDATFESESGTLAGILNTAMGDILRYSINVRDEEYLLSRNADFEVPADAVCYKNKKENDQFFVFTSIDYGIQDAYFYLKPHSSGKNMSVLYMNNLRNGRTTELVNTGAYPDLLVSDLNLMYQPRLGNGVEGGYFDIEYKIKSASDPNKIRDVHTIVRLMND